MKLFKQIAAFVVFMVLAFATSYLITGHPGLGEALLIYTAAGGVATPFSWNMTYLPEIISFTAATQLTSLRIETQEDGVLHDWVTASLNAMANYRKVGTVTANTYYFRIGDGELRPKNVTISGITAAAGAVPFYVQSSNKGTVPFKSSNAQILALNPTRFTKFTALFIPTLATGTDYAQITYDDGHSQRWEMEDLRNESSLYQQVEGIIIDNLHGTIKDVIVRTAAATPAYILAVFVPGTSQVAQ